ncbi:MAG: type II secretion system protein GspM [Desulfurivibrio sp.]
MINDLRVRIESQLETLLADIPPRQRPLLFIGLGLLVLLLIWLLLLAPLGSSRATLAREIAAQEQELAWMREAAKEVRQYTTTAGNGGRAGGGASPLAAIDTSARQLGLGQAMQRVEPVGSREVRVWLENAAFDDLLRWLVLLQAGHGIEVAEIVVEPGRTASGLVNSRLTLIRE